MKKLFFMLVSVMLAFGSCDFIGMEDPEQSEQTDDKNEDGKDEGKDEGEDEGKDENEGEDNGENKEENEDGEGNEGGDESGDNENDENGGGEGPEDGVVLEPDQQKVRLEEIAENLMDEYPSEDFKDLFSLADRFSERYLENVSDNYWDPVFDYCEERGEELFFYTESESTAGKNIYRKYNTEAFLEFSHFHGQITLGQYSATCEDYDGTRMVFDLGNDSYVVEIAPSGKTTKAIYTFEDVYGYEMNNGYWVDDYTWVDDYVMIHAVDRYHFEVDVPERIRAVVTKNGSDFAVVDIAFILNFNKNGIDITTDCFKVSATAQIDGHSAVIEKTGYDASTGRAEVSFTLRKGAQDIIRAQSSANAKFELITEVDESNDWYDDYVYPEFSLAKDFNMFVDVLGQLQVRASCVDGLKVSEYVENFYDADNLNVVERAIDNINNYVDCGLYYDGTNVRQAEVVMDYYVERDDYYGYEWYELDPIIVFPDGSKYAFYEYFDEGSFDGVLTSFELWIDLYATMLEHYFD